MFDKLIVSDEQGAEFKGRRRYFMVSTFVVGIMFITAVVFSLYAADIGLGNDEFEMSMIVAPMPPEAPEPPKPVEPHEQRPAQQSSLPTRNENILRLEENPSVVPTNLSVTRNLSLSRPPGDFILANGPEGGMGPAGPVGNDRGEVGTSSAGPSEPSPTTERIPDPPPVIKPKPPVPPIVSKGVINGKATFLPAPPYPAPARMINAGGAVNVQVTIDESGKVISSRAVSGHPLLRQAAENAAWKAKFSPTYLSEVPVKVTGVIVYNFKRD